MKMFSTLLTAVVLFAGISAHAQYDNYSRGDSRDRDRGGWGRGGGGGNGSECQDAIRSLQYAQAAGQRATQAVQNSNRICGTTNIQDPCHNQISAAWQQSVRDIQDADARRQRACN